MSLFVILCVAISIRCCLPLLSPLGFLSTLDRCIDVCASSTCAMLAEATGSNSNSRKMSWHSKRLSMPKKKSVAGAAGALKFFPNSAFGKSSQQLLASQTGCGAPAISGLQHSLDIGVAIFWRTILQFLQVIGPDLSDGNGVWLHGSRSPRSPRAPRSRTNGVAAMLANHWPAFTNNPPKASGSGKGAMKKCHTRV